MKAERALPMLVYCDAGLTILSIIVNRMMSEFLPAPLLEFLEKEGAAPRGTGDLVLIGLWAAVSAATLLAWVGLLRLWRPARAIYFWTWVAAVLLLPFEAIWVFSPVGYVLDTAASLAGGALLGVSYFSDARTHFEGAARSVPEAGAALA